MKKSFLVCVVIIMVITLFAGCSSSGAPQNTAAVSNAGTGVVEVAGQSGSGTGTGTASTAFSAEDVISKVDVQSYSYSSSYSNYAALVLTNNSDYDCQLEIAVDFYDSNGGIVGTSSDSIDAFAKGTASALVFSCEDSFAKFEYQLKAKEIASYYVPVNQNLSCEVSTATKKAVISATNNGDITAEYVQYIALFFNGGELVYHSWGYVTDSDSEIKPGDTVRDEANCYVNFDSVQVYLDGRGSK